jgi:hypothetical protein
VRDKRQWAQLFDRYDPDSQRRAAADMRQAMSAIAPELAGRTGSLSDREVFVAFFQGGNIGEVRILSEQITGDIAILDTQIRTNKNDVWVDADPRVELHRIAGKWTMFWPK